MARLSEDEREAWRRNASLIVHEPPLTPTERFVAPTVEARERYIRFATQAACFYRGDRPHRAEGHNWKL